MSELDRADAWPQDASPVEIERLRALARELAEACPDAQMSAGFAARLRERVAPRWHWRDAFRREPLLRLAAGLLVACALAVPVSAAVYLLLVRPARQPALSVDFAPAVPLRREPRPDVETVPPLRPDLEDLQALAVATERDNRFALSSYDWRRRFPRPPGQPPDRRALASLPAGAAVGLELRLGMRRPAPQSDRADWSDAAAPELWAELERRLALDRSDWPAGLEARVRALWAVGDQESRNWLAPWMVILEGPQVTHGYALPEPGADLRVFWESVRWTPPLHSGR
ncbi:MAG: hypothetical protein EYC70_03450 [Planctomycetota bacterium]|nr:MAG: hypothetical protein EYC70_03450 [Planctomycetota bacterium]